MIMPSGEWEDLLRERRAEERRQTARRKLAREAKAAFPGPATRLKQQIPRFSRGDRRAVTLGGVAGMGRRLALLIDPVFSIWGRGARRERHGLAADCSGCGEGQNPDLRGGL